MSTSHRGLRAFFAAFVFAGVLATVAAQNRCYWSPDGVQCDDYLPGPAGLSWSYNGPGRGGSSGGYPPVYNPPSSSGCRNGLPFGLNNCICDGEVAGLSAGTRACQRVKAQCGRFQQFSTDNFLESLQQVCDAFTQQACENTALRVAQNDWDCRRILAEGNGRVCSGSRARELFEEETARYCAPLSPVRGGTVGDSDDSDSRNDRDDDDSRDDKSSDEKSSEEERSSDEGDDDRDGCTRDVRRSAAGAARVGCRAALQLCAANAWGPSVNPDPPCRSDMRDRCKEDAWDEAERNNRFCHQILNQGSSLCQNSVVARVAFRRAVDQACTPVN